MTNNGPAQARNPAPSKSLDTEDQAILPLQCPACGSPEQIIWVYRHGKCVHCYTNGMLCCGGVICEDLS